MTDRDRETASIIDEVVRLITRRAAEGADINDIAGGVAAGLTVVARQNVVGRELVETIVALVNMGLAEDGHVR